MNNITRIEDYLQANNTLQSLSVNNERLKNGGGGGNNNDMEARVAKLEANVDNIDKSISEIKQDVRDIKKDARTDFRLLFGALITVAIGLASIMAKGFGWF